jgi:peptidoglycan/LPS O-acetylase OafA/YrhL
MYASTPKAHITALDGLRGVAALCVVYLHLTIVFELTSVLRHPYLAVDFFFCLSGVVVAHVYERDLLGSLSVPSFMGKRLLRLYPLLFAGAALAAAVALIRPHILADPVARNELPQVVARSFLLLPTLTPTPFDHAIFPLNPSTWSLVFEIAVNLLYAAIVRFLRMPVLIGLLILSAIWAAYTAVTAGDLCVGFSPETLWGGPARTCFPFFAGVLIARLFQKGRLPAFTLSPTVAALILIVAFYVPTPPALTAWYDLFWAVLAFPLMIALLIRHQTRGWQRKLCLLSGEISYPLYILHYPLLIVAYHFAHRASPPLALALAVAAIPACAIAALAASRLYDRPLRRFLGRCAAVMEGRHAPLSQRRPESARPSATDEAEREIGRIERRAQVEPQAELARYRRTGAQ